MLGGRKERLSGDLRQNLSECVQRVCVCHSRLVKLEDEVMESVPIFYLYMGSEH